MPCFPSRGRAFATGVTGRKNLFPEECVKEGLSSVRHLLETQGLLQELREINRHSNLWRGGAVPGAREVLGDLKGKGYQLGVISNSDGRLETLLNEVGLAEYFSVIVDSHVVGFEKPDPRIFHWALERTGVTPNEAVYVGDFYSLDVVGARRVGLDAILLDPLGVWPLLDCVKAKDLFEVRSLLPASP